jgi:hypothetical protein
MATRVLGLFTYNGIDGVPAGWQEKEGRRLFVVHNGRSGRDDKAKLGNDVQHRLWQQLEPVLGQLDQVVVYLGSQGCLAFVEKLAAVPAAKLVFVTCGCLLEEKVAILRTNGFGPCPRLPCECGGHRTLARLARNFLEHGALDHQEEHPLPFPDDVT